MERKLISKSFEIEEESKTNSLNACRNHPQFEILYLCARSECRAFLCPQCFKEHKHRKKTELHESLLKKYRFLSFLGNGSFGKVFAVEEDLERFAVKVIDVFDEVDTEFTPQMKQAYLNEYLKEAELHQTLKNQHIVNYFEHCYIDSDEIIVIKMELADGSLKEQLGKVNKEQTLTWFAQICAGVSYLHMKNIIHRDLKTGNILIKDNIARICDFGAAKLIQQTREMTYKINKELFLGTQEYLAPEISSQDRKQFTKATDIWALGVILFKMVTNGKHPLLIKEKHEEDMGREEKLDKMQEMMEKIRGNPKRLESAFKRLFMGDIIRECLSVEPEERIEIQQLVELVKDKLKEEGIDVFAKTNPKESIHDELIDGKQNNNSFATNCSENVMKPGFTGVIQPNDPPKRKKNNFLGIFFPCCCRQNFN